MLEERTNINISQVVILVVTEDGTVQEFIKDKAPYLRMLSETVADWRLAETVKIWSEENVQ